MKPPAVRPLFTMCGEVAPRGFELEGVRCEEHHLVTVYGETWLVHSVAMRGSKAGAVWKERWRERR